VGETCEDESPRLVPAGNATEPARQRTARRDRRGVLQYHPLVMEVRFCTNCGRPLAFGLYCGGCGERIEIAPLHGGVEAGTLPQLTSPAEGGGPTSLTSNWDVGQVGTENARATQVGRAMVATTVVGALVAVLIIDPYVEDSPYFEHSPEVPMTVAAWTVVGAALSIAWALGRHVESSNIHSSVGIRALIGAIVGAGAATIDLIFKLTEGYGGYGFGGLWILFLGALGAFCTFADDLPRRPVVAAVIGGGVGLGVGAASPWLLGVGFGDGLADSALDLALRPVFGAASGLGVALGWRASARPKACQQPVIGVAGGRTLASVRTATPTVQSVNGLAVTSLVLGILGVGLVGLILGIVALGQIKRSGGTEGGRNIAIAGVVLSCI